MHHPDKNAARLTYTVNEAARALAYSPYTIRLFIRTGRLPAFKVGAHWRIPAEALHTLIHIPQQSAG